MNSRLCTVRGCGRRLGDPSVAFYRFPQNEEAMSHWKIKLQIPEWVTVTRYMRVCSVNFEPQFVGAKRLYSNAIPTLELGDNLPSNSTGKRKSKVSTEQKEIYCSFLEKNIKMRTGKTHEVIVKELWEQLSAKLNAVGPAKNKAEEWKVVFDNWRYGLGHKMRVEQQKTNSKPANPSKRDQLEERALAVWEPVTDEQVCSVGSEENLEDTSPFLLDESLEESGKKCKSPISPLKITDDSTNSLQKMIEENKQTQAESTNKRLDKIDASLQQLISVQKQTLQATNKIANALERIANKFEQNSTNF